jgi:hypothetical protein
LAAVQLQVADPQRGDLAPSQAGADDRLHQRQCVGGHVGAQQLVLRLGEGADDVGLAAAAVRELGVHTRVVRAQPLLHRVGQHREEQPVVVGDGLRGAAGSLQLADPGRDRLVVDQLDGGEVAGQDADLVAAPGQGVGLRPAPCVQVGLGERGEVGLAAHVGCAVRVPVAGALDPAVRPAQAGVLDRELEPQRGPLGVERLGLLGGGPAVTLPPLHPVAGAAVAARAPLQVCLRHLPRPLLGAACGTPTAA